MVKQIVKKLIIIKKGSKYEITSLTKQIKYGIKKNSTHSLS